MCPTGRQRPLEINPNKNSSHSPLLRPEEDRGTTLTFSVLCKGFWFIDVQTAYSGEMFRLEIFPQGVTV